MSRNEILTNAVLVVFALDVALLVSLVVGKLVHRRLQTNHEQRRIAYVATLSKVITGSGEELRIGPRIVGDPAFLDALIDIRTSIVGSDADVLSEVVERHGVMDKYARRLTGPRLFLTRRLRAAVALAEVADSSWAPVLMAHLDDREPEIRIQAARGLGRMMWTPAIDRILGRFSKESPWVRARFADTLVNYGATATWPFIAYIRLNHRSDRDSSTTAVRTLATIGDDEAVTPLVELLDESSDPEVRIALVEALGTLGNPLAVAPLLGFTTDQDWRLRAKAASALGVIGDESAVPALCWGLTDSNWWVRRNSAGALAQIPGGLNELYAAIDSHDPYARDAAAEALTDVGEVIEARNRIESGAPSADDVALVAFIESSLEEVG